MLPIEYASDFDPTRPIEIADRVWWVGHFLDGDPFQCHVYLIEHGDQSVLFDPGSKLTIDHSLKKIEQITSFSNIRYFVCHHQDPDITGAMPEIDKMITRDDAVLVTHWRAAVLLKHYALDLPFWQVEDNQWELDLGGRMLKFVFTPYAHFPGAFCTYDTATGVLFSSDLFGGFTEGFSLVAKDEGYFESLRPFHEHYIPSRDILAFALSEVGQYDLKLIAPQHGSIIPKRLIPFMIEKLRHLDCGLYLFASNHTDILSLSKFNRILHDITETMVLYRDFRDIATHLHRLIGEILPIQTLEFFVTLANGDILHLEPETRYRGNVDAPPAYLNGILGQRRGRVETSDHKQVIKGDAPYPDGTSATAIMVPLFNQNTPTANHVAVVRLNRDIAITDDVRILVDQMVLPLQVAVERESIFRFLDMERQKHYQLSIRDTLTGLFTRFYMEETINRQFDIQDREDDAAIALIMFDIDHFKQINDTFGHDIGDVVLAKVADLIRQTSRGGDLPVRLGGEEFALFVIGKSAINVPRTAERVRRSVEEVVFECLPSGRSVTISGGIAMRRPHEEIASLLKRADVALYRAKNSGRNRICEAEEFFDAP